MSSIQVEVNKADMRALQFKLRKMSDKAPMHIKNALNRAGTQVRKMINAGRSQGYTIKPAKFKSDITVQRANVAHLDYTITASGRPHTLSKSFKTSMPKGGGKADVTKTGLKKLVTSTGGAAFVFPSGKASGLMGQRKGKERNPTRVFYGTSVPKMVEKIYEGERGGQGRMEDRIQEILHKEIKAEIAKLSK